MSTRTFQAFLFCAAMFPGAAPAAVVFFDASNPANAPATLSATGIYSSIAGKITDTALKHFEVNAALWSDGSAKQRWVILPPGKQIAYADSTDVFDYPDSTIFVKNFYLDSVDGNSGTRRYWETRLLVNKRDAFQNPIWHGFSYKWNAAGTEAYLVNPAASFDTVFYYQPSADRPQTYKKWRFPSTACAACHKSESPGEALERLPRGVLGFFPAQLKRPAPGNPSINQIDALFDAGVFSGTRPGPESLARRWKGIGEAIPEGPADHRFAVIDTMARSYIAANCSGCHGDRGIEVTGGIPFHLNYDFYDLNPRIEFGAADVNGPMELGKLDEDSTELLDGRRKFLFAASRAGLNTSPGAIWDMSLPPGAAYTEENSPPEVPANKLVFAGYPGLSPILYRQLAMRKSSAQDSLNYRLRLIREGDLNQELPWIFNNPWGSQAWRNDLAAHEVDVNQFLGNFTGSDANQMPPLATYIPDTAAMKILGEWVKNYRTRVRIEGNDSVVSVRNQKRTASGTPRVQNRLLLVPEGWEGRAHMLGINGHSHVLQSAGKGRYVIPGDVPPGVYYFRVGGRVFRASLLR